MFVGVVLVLNSPCIATELLGGWFPGVFGGVFGVWRCFVVLSGACAAFAGAGGACDDAVGVGEVSPAVLAYHDPAECFVAGAEGADVCSGFAA